MEKNLERKISKLLKACGFSRIAAMVRVNQTSGKQALDNLVKRPMLCGRYYDVIKAAHAALK